MQWLSKLIKRCGSNKEISKLGCGRDHPNFGSGISFNLYPASGGIVISVNSYNEKMRENISSLHIITNEQDTAAELAKIISLESLRR